VIALLADESLRGEIIHELRRLNPAIDLITAAEAGLRGEEDSIVLEWAAQHDRLVVSSDEQTMIGFAYQRVRARQRMPGLIDANQDLPTGIVVADLLLIAECLLPGEWEDQVRYLPL
jgi:hypothetical protein